MKAMILHQKIVFGRTTGRTMLIVTLLMNAYKKTSTIATDTFKDMTLSAEVSTTIFQVGLPASY